MSKTKSFDAVLGITKKVIKIPVEKSISTDVMDCAKETVVEHSLPTRESVEPVASVEQIEPTEFEKPVESMDQAKSIDQVDEMTITKMYHVEPSVKTEAKQVEEKLDPVQEAQSFEKAHEKAHENTRVDRGVNQDLIAQMRDEIQFLRAQIEIKDNQIESKDHQLSSKDDLLKNFQVLLKSEQDRVLRLETELTQNTCQVDVESAVVSDKEVSWFKKLFQKT